MMDIPGISMYADDTAVVVTADGHEYTPSLQNLASDRPFFLDQLQGDWEAELILAQNAAGTRADPVIVHNTATGGRIGIFYQTAGQDNDPRGEVISEWINNYFMKYIAAGNPYAGGPKPADGSINAQTWVSCQWRAGDFAVSHNVYFSDNFADVDAGTGDAFRGNVALKATYLVAGFAGCPYPTGLVAGTTYYWRIDEVNDLNPESPWKGKVWSFWIPPKKAYDPNPADGARFVDPDVTLRWTGGLSALINHVYFGDNPDDVAAGTGGTDKGTVGPSSPSFVPGTLEREKTYYWRVDEFDQLGATHTGGVWSFTIAKVGGGLMGEYYHWSGDYPPSQPFQVFVLSRIDPQINWNWGDPGSPDPLVDVDGFACKWTGEVEAAFTETYTFYMTTDDGQRLWIDGQLIIDYWQQQGMTEWSGTIDLVAGQKYSIEAWMYENAGGAGAELRWSSPSTPKQIIPQAALTPPERASRPSPPNGATDVKQTPVLRWDAGYKAAKHNVYLGTDATAVANATTASAGIYRGQQNLDVTSYLPSEAPLAWNSTYYWRIDEVNAADTWKGSVWSFTTANFIVVDDFEDYTDDVGSRIFQTWKDGLGWTQPAPGYLGNGTGSAVGNSPPPYAEQTIVHGGVQSMPLAYDNSGAAGKARYSETVREWASPQDWTRNNVKVLTLYFYGALTNDAAQLYVALEDNAGHVKVVNHPDPEVLREPIWHEWNIELSQFSAAGVNLAAVKKMYIGLGNRTSPTVGGTGTIYIDDIRVYPSRPVPSMAKPAADIAEPYDCKVDYEDLRILAYEWLSKTQLLDWQERVAYWDIRYRTNWAGEADSIAVRDGLAAAGYTILNADQLKTWMNARIADKKLSVVVFCRDNAPDTVVESVDAACTLRKYLDAGGKIVFYADIPFWDIGHADGTFDNPQTAGANNILGFDNTIVLWDSNTQVTPTAAGISWGLTQTWGSRRPIATTDVTVLATDAAGNAAAWVRHYLPGDKARGFVRLWDRTGHPPVGDIIRVAESKLAADLHEDGVVDFKDFAVLAHSWLEEILWP